MNREFEEIVLEARSLPDDRQGELAEILRDLVLPKKFKLTAEQLADIELSKQEAREGKFATKEEMADLWRRFRE
jgi:predicted transcriptional regulator